MKLLLICITYDRMEGRDKELYPGMHPFGFKSLSSLLEDGVYPDNEIANETRQSGSAS